MVGKGRACCCPASRALGLVVKVVGDGYGGIGCGAVTANVSALDSDGIDAAGTSSGAFGSEVSG